VVHDRPDLPHGLTSQFGGLFLGISQSGLDHLAGLLFGYAGQFCIVDDGLSNKGFGSSGRNLYNRLGLCIGRLDFRLCFGLGICNLRAGLSISFLAG
jgi:hypothetical protein